MARLIHKKKIILNNMKYKTNVLDLFLGLMFASKPKIEEGICLTLPGKNKKTRIHMMFCFYPYEVLFVNSELEVVDKTILNPWTFSYKSEEPFKYAIESWPGKFNSVKIGDKLDINNY
jgi:uncharacterized protein